MKTSYSIVFFFLLFLLVAAIFFWLEKSGLGEGPTLRRVVDCRNDIIDDSILDLDADTSLIGAFITFEQTPIDQLTKEKLQNLEVEIDEGSQIFETSSHLLAKIPTVSLCQLSQIEGVKAIFIPAVKESDDISNETP